MATPAMADTAKGQFHVVGEVQASTCHTVPANYTLQPVTQSMIDAGLAPRTAVDVEIVCTGSPVSISEISFEGPAAAGLTDAFAVGAGTTASPLGSVDPAYNIGVKLFVSKAIADQTEDFPGATPDTVVTPNANLLSGATVAFTGTKQLRLQAQTVASTGAETLQDARSTDDYHVPLTVKLEY
jgi:hypothetical protein